MFKVNNVNTIRTSIGVVIVNITVFTLKRPIYLLQIYEIVLITKRRNILCLKTYCISIWEGIVFDLTHLTPGNRFPGQ